MAWIESHTVLIRHRKLKEFTRALRLRPAHGMGHLHALWHAALEQQEDGDLIGWSDEFIAESADYPGDALQFVQLLQKTGWLDGKLLHDWLDYAGMFLIKKYSTSNRGRLVEIWKKHGRVYGSDQKASLPNQPNQPLPNPPTKPKDKTSLSLPAGERVDSKPKTKREDPVLPDWQGMIDHMDKTWSAFKKKKTGNDVRYPWPDRSDKRGQGMWGTLRSRAKLYSCYGLMALWDIYLLRDKEKPVDDKDWSWVRSTGYSVEAFLYKIASLVDDPRWKSLASKHEDTLAKPKLHSIGDVLKQIQNGVEVAR